MLLYTIFWGLCLATVQVLCAMCIISQFPVFYKIRIMSKKKMFDVIRPMHERLLLSSKMQTMQSTPLGQITL